MTDIQESLCRQRAWVKAWPFVCPPGLPEPSKPRLFTKQRFSSVLGTACVPSRCPRAVVVPCQGDGPPCGRQQGGVPPSPSPCFLKTGSPHPWFLCPPRCLTPTTSFPFYLLQLISSFLLRPPNLPLTVSCSPASLTFEMWSLLGKLAGTQG